MRRHKDLNRTGLSQTDTARLFGVARGTVNRWRGLWQRQAAAALNPNPEVRPIGVFVTGAFSKCVQSLCQTMDRNHRG